MKKSGGRPGRQHSKSELLDYVKRIGAGVEVLDEEIAKIKRRARVRVVVVGIVALAVGFAGGYAAALKSGRVAVAEVTGHE